MSASRILAVVWCERCQRSHSIYPITQSDIDKLMSDAAKKIGEYVDAWCVEAAYRASNPGNDRS